MSGKEPATSPKDSQVVKAVVLWRKAPALSVTQVMLAAEFMFEDANNKGEQMWIRRRMPGSTKVWKTLEAQPHDSGDDAAGSAKPDKSGDDILSLSSAFFSRG